MDKERFKELLDAEYSWPSSYTFKFIVKQSALSSVLELFPLEQPSVRQSSRANFVAVTFTVTMTASAEVILVYERAAQMEDVIAL